MGSLVAELAEKLSSATNNFDIDEGTMYVNTSADTVGIGTTNPASKLDVQGTMQVGVNDTGHDVKFFGATAGAYLEWDESADELEIRGGAATPGKLLLSNAETTVVDGNKLGQIDFQAPIDSAGTDAILVGASIWAEADATFSSSVNATELVFATGASELAAEKMRLTSAGNVGIGTTAPDSTLHLLFTDDTTNAADNSSLKHTSGLYMENLSTTTEAHSSIGFRTATTDGGIGLVYSGTANQGRFSFNLEGSERMVILHNGNVGIGSTVPETTLHVGNTASGTAGATGKPLIVASTLATVYDGTASNSWQGLKTNNSDGTSNRTATGLTFDHRTSSSGVAAIMSTSAAADRADMRFITRGSDGVNERMMIDDAGKVGIGTTAPSRLLHVYGSGTGTDFFDGHMILEGTTAANPVGIGFINRGNVSSYSDLGHIRMEIDSGNAKGKMTFSTRNSDGGNSDTGVRMVIKSDGNVGIGTTAPTNPLDVNGTGFAGKNAYTGTPGTSSFNVCSIGRVLTTSTLATSVVAISWAGSNLSDVGVLGRAMICLEKNFSTYVVNVMSDSPGVIHGSGTGNLTFSLTSSYLTAVSSGYDFSQLKVSWAVLTCANQA